LDPSPDPSSPGDRVASSSRLLTVSDETTVIYRMWHETKLVPSGTLTGSAVVNASMFGLTSAAGASTKHTVHGTLELDDTSQTNE
jgi:hypothetical protein